MQVVNDEKKLHCPVPFCREPVTRSINENKLTLAQKAQLAQTRETGERLDCCNETHEHYASGLLVKIDSGRTAYRMPPEYRQAELRKHGMADE
jgi:hypothetical protein